MFRLKFIVYILFFTLAFSGASYAGHCSGGHDKKSDSCTEKSPCSEKSNDRSET